jgi:hypothetical protein
MTTTDIVTDAYRSLFGGERNLSTGERIGSVVFGLAALGTALRRRPLQSVLLAGAGLALVGRGMSGHCPMKAALTGEGSRAMPHRRRDEPRPLPYGEAAPYGNVAPAAQSSLG